MIASRVRLTSNPPEKQNVSCSKYNEALFLINLRLKELALLVPLKQTNIELIRKRMSGRGTSARLELELAEQQEELQDLVQLAEDWFTLAKLTTEQPSTLNDLSEPIKRLLRGLGIQFDRSATK